jgi:colanic acid/amylovoran biosynthesis glycosyltransferase
LTSRKGLPAFVYEELKEAESFDDIKVTPYIFRRGKGPYMPESNWDAKYVTFYSLLVGSLFLLLTPFRFLKVVLVAIKDAMIIDSIIAIGMSRSIRVQEISHLIAFEGLHGLRIAYMLQVINPNLKISVVVHAEMIRLEGNRLRLTRKILKNVQSIVSPTELNRTRIAKKFHYPMEKILFNRMSVNTEDYEQSKKFRILIVGFWAQRKGHETLFKAVQELEHSNIQVDVIGGDVWGGEGFDVEAYVRNHNLSDIIKLHGKVSDNTKKYFLNTCDLFVLPCKTPQSGIIEGLPVSLMEAMSFSKPVLSTFHSGIPELLPKEALVKEDDYELLSSKISQLISDQSMRQEWGEINRKIIEDKYSNNIYSFFSNI